MNVEICSVLAFGTEEVFLKVTRNVDCYLRVLGEQFLSFNAFIQQMQFWMCPASIFLIEFCLISFLHILDMAGPGQYILHVSSPDLFLRIFVRARV
jgi:hypothetical protein